MFYHPESGRSPRGEDLVNQALTSKYLKGWRRSVILFDEFGSDMPSITTVHPQYRRDRFGLWAPAGDVFMDKRIENGDHLICPADDIRLRIANDVERRLNLLVRHRESVTEIEVVGDGTPLNMGVGEYARGFAGIRQLDEHGVSRMTLWDNTKTTITEPVIIVPATAKNYKGLVIIPVSYFEGKNLRYLFY